MSPSDERKEQGDSLGSLEGLRLRWQDEWEPALSFWSRFTKLEPPRWCKSQAEEIREGLTGSFAMIRLRDHRVVVSLGSVAREKLEAHGRVVLAHEIGHHVYVPANLSDHARLMARIRRGLSTRKNEAGLVANLYADLLVNDRLQRSEAFDVAAVYRTLHDPASEPGKLWSLYMRIYEVLWSLRRGDLAPRDLSDEVLGDADLGARLIRAYGRDWLSGAGRFAALCLPYLAEETYEQLARALPPWLDTIAAGAGGELPEGLTGLDEDELDGGIHPSEDPALTGLGTLDVEEEQVSDGPGAGGVEEIGGRKNRYREPGNYVELMKSLGVTLDPAEIVVRYYRERALPHVIPFPLRERQRSTDPLPEGLDVWDPASPLASVDWIESVSRSPVLIPGVTTVERVFGECEGGSPAKEPVDLYLGVDCSGSMGNPGKTMSYPVLAGTVMALSALRAGARVQVCLSGEPGKWASTKGFLRRERDVLGTLTSYLGTGYAFGVQRLADAFLQGQPFDRPVHAILITDADLFHMCKELKAGWEIMARAAEVLEGRATAVLQLPWVKHVADDLARLRDCGWSIHLVDSMKDVLAFAKAFSRQTYGRKGLHVRK